MAAPAKKTPRHGDVEVDAEDLEGRIVGGRGGHASLDSTRIYTLPAEDDLDAAASTATAETSRAWSVVLKGRARAMEQTEELLDTFVLSLFPWQGGTKNRFIRIVPDVLTGRRFPVVDADSWLTPMSDARRTPSE